MHPDDGDIEAVVPVEAAELLATPDIALDVTDAGGESLEDRNGLVHGRFNLGFHFGEEERARHARYNDTADNLEPNLKEGPGGLRLEVIKRIERCAATG